jgi:hypothetical protein
MIRITALRTAAFSLSFLLLVFAPAHAQATPAAPPEAPPVIDTAAATTTGGTWPCAGFAEKAGASFDKRLIQIIAARSARLTTAAGKRRAILAVASQQKKKD